MAAREPTRYSNSASCRRWSKGLLAAGAVQHRRHPPREPLRPPGPFERALGIQIHQLLAARLESFRQGSRQPVDVGHRQVQPFGARRWNDVCGVTGEEQPTEPHRFDDEAAHPRDALLKDWPLVRSPPVGGREPQAQLGPDAVIAPSRDIFVGRALQVEPGDLW